MKKEGVSGLVLSADSVAATLKVAEHLLEMTDEVVIVYSGNTGAFRRLFGNRRSNRIRPFYAIRLGYAEPLRQYGASLCRYRMIAMLDVDERFSNPSYARTLLMAGNADVYRVQRQDKGLFTSQYRLFAKNMLEWRGYLHETPRIYGKVIDIGKESLFIRHGGKKRTRDYAGFDSIFPIDSSFWQAARNSYIWYRMKKKNPTEFISRFLAEYVRCRRTYANLSGEDRKIIGKLRKLGITRYLHLDERRVIRRLNSNYGGKRGQGIPLLVSLIRAARTKA